MSCKRSIRPAASRAAQQFRGLRSWTPSDGRRLVHTPATTSPETPLGLLHLLQGHKEAPGGSADGEEQLRSGFVVSVTGSLVRLALQGPVAVGHLADVAGCRGLVLQYDRHGAVVALLDAGSPGFVPPSVGAKAAVQAASAAAVDVPSAIGGEAAATTVLHVTSVVGSAEIGDAGGGPRRLLRLPAPPLPQYRQPLDSRLPSGLAAVEALAPIAKGHRVGLAGPVGTGKSSAARMVLRMQDPEVVCVYAAQKPAAQLAARGLFAGCRAVVIHADPARDSPCAQYLVPLAALQVATELRERGHQHVLLVLDDLVDFAEAAAALGTPPLGASQVLGTAVEAAGCFRSKDGKESSLTVIAVADWHKDDELPPVLRNLWRSVEPSLDMCVNFTMEVAARGILPSIDVDGLLALGPAPLYQAPFFRQLHAVLSRKLRRRRELSEKLELGKQLQLHAEVEDVEELGSAEIARALLGHADPRSVPEVAVLLVAAVVYHFPPTVRPSSTSIAAFQAALLAMVRAEDPALWEALCSAEGLEASAAAETMHRLGELLYRHRQHFELTCPVG